MSIILSAALAAREATERAVAEASRALPAPSRAEVERVIESLPAAAAKGREVDPSATWFCVLQWARRDRSSHALAGVVLVELRQMGLDASMSIDGADGTLRVGYESLFAAADAQRRAAWESKASELWRQRAGDDAAVNMTSGSISFAVRGDGVIRDWPKVCPAPYDAIERDPASVIAEAAVALGLPAWGPLSSLLSAWRVRAGDGSAIDAQSGRWANGAYRQVPCLMFTAAGGSWAIDEADVHGWTQADLIAMAADECGLTPPAPVTPQRQEKRRGGEKRASA